MKMGTYVIQTDFTVEECRRVVERIWKTLYSEYDDLKMSEYISESQENLLRMIKTTTGDDENYTCKIVRRFDLLQKKIRSLINKIY